MIIEAKFIGKPSLGYENGKKYKLRIDANSICRLDGTGKCPYGSVAAFMRNWTEIETLKSDGTVVTYKSEPKPYRIPFKD